MLLALYIAFIVVSLACAVVVALKGKWGVLLVGFVVAIVWIVGAIRLAKPRSWWARNRYDEDGLRRAKARRENPRLRWLERGGLVALFLLVVAISAGTELYRIPSAAMEPTLLCEPPAGIDLYDGCSGHTADRIVAVRYVFGRDPQRGDVASFRAPSMAR